MKLTTTNGPLNDTYVIEVTGRELAMIAALSYEREQGGPDNLYQQVLNFAPKLARAGEELIDNNAWPYNQGEIT